VNVNIDAKWGGFKNLFGSEGGFIVRAEGQGSVVFACYGALEVWNLQAGQTLTARTIDDLIGDMSTWRSSVSTELLALDEQVRLSGLTSSNADLAHGSLHGFALIAGEGIAVLNHNAVSTAHAALALHDAGRLLDTLEVCGALDLEAFGANTALLDPAIADVRPYPGLVRSLARLREALAGSYLWQPAAARNLQDPLCFRCLPQLLGAARDPHRYALDQLSVELNAHQGNPLVISGPAERIVHRNQRTGEGSQAEGCSGVLRHLYWERDVVELVGTGTNRPQCQWSHPVAVEIVQAAMPGSVSPLSLLPVVLPTRGRSH